MTKEELREIMPELGFSYALNEEFSRDEYENMDYNGSHIRIYVDRNTTRMELVVGNVSYKKNYTTYGDLAYATDMAQLISHFMDFIKKFYNP